LDYPINIIQSIIQIIHKHHLDPRTIRTTLPSASARSAPRLVQGVPAKKILLKKEQNHGEKYGKSMGKSTTNMEVLMGK